jgi:hypothetical protein
MALEQEIAAFDDQKETLEKHHFGKFVVFRGGDLIGAFDSFEAAASVAVHMFGRGPYLIRQVGAPVPRLPASVLYHPAQPQIG